MARLARVVVAGIARHVAQRDRKSACEHDDAGNRLSVIDGGGTTPYVANALNQYTSANGTYYQYDTSGNMIYDGHYVFDYDPENRLNKVKRFEQGPTALALACDTTLTFTMGGDADWFTQTQEHYFEGDAAQSGDISDSQQSWMQATVSGTGYISFYWKVSSDGSDYLRFYIDDELKEQHAGSAGWSLSTKYYVSSGGSHTLKWVYIKNNNGSGESDCAWVDKVLWEVPVPVGVDKGVDSLLAYTSGGNSTWSYLTSGYYGGDSAQSGQISDSNDTWMQTQVEGAGTFKFWWKVSSESGADYLEFYIGAQLQDSISGTGGDWAEKSYNLGTGAHTLKWRYVKDDSESSGEDCGWVDHVQWSEPIAEPATDAWTTLTYTYDASGRRIEKRYDDTLVLRYIYDGDHCIAEYDASNNLRRKYIYSLCVDEPICMIDGSTTNYYHFDALGSVIALTDASGDAVQVYEYSIYGQVAASNPNHPNRFMFTGREFDKETGLYYYRARYYNAEIGRFLQTDPTGYGDGMNWYVYCRNSPLTLTDPSGRDVTPPGGNPKVPISPDAPVGANILGITIDWGKPDYPVKPGEQWQIADFFGWYRHGNGDRDPVNLANIGLLDDFQNSAREKANVAGFIAQTQSEARGRAIEMATKLLSKDAASWWDHEEYDRRYDYDFAPGTDWGVIWQVLLEDTLVVLGAGHVSAHVEISAVNIGWGAMWGVEVTYDLKDEFKNPSDLHDDPTIPDKDWAYCEAYALTANWSWCDFGYIAKPKE